MEWPAVSAAIWLDRSMDSLAPSTIVELLGTTHSQRLQA
jgi:hypothetical protein